MENGRRRDHGDRGRGVRVLGIRRFGLGGDFDGGRRLGRVEVGIDMKEHLAVSFYDVCSDDKGQANRLFDGVVEKKDLLIERVDGGIFLDGN